MNELALFAGVGGGLLASKWLLGWRTICYVEREPYVVERIRERIAQGMLDEAPIWDDVKTFDGRPWAGRVDIVTGGFPCQPYSSAGRQKGSKDERNLWPDTLRVIRQVRPRWGFLENVPRLLHFDYFGKIIGSLAESGFDVRWDSLPANEFGAPTKRERVYLVAHAHRFRSQAHGILCGPTDKALSESKGKGKWNGRYSDGHGNRIRLLPDFEFLGMVDGMAHRVERCKAIGNGQVPIVVATAWTLLSSAFRSMPETG